MTEPVTNVAAASGDLAAGLPASVSPTAPHQAEARLFAQMMMQPGGTAVPSGSVNDMARSIAAQFGTQSRSFEDLRRSMFKSMDFRDPIKTMFTLTDHSLEAHTMFAKLHISTSLASATTSLFGTLLKNQQ